MAALEIKLQVWRALHDQEGHAPDLAPSPREAHRARRRALGAALADGAFEVRDWGDAADPDWVTELVELTLEVVGEPAATPEGAAGHVTALLAEGDNRAAAAAGALFGDLFAAFRRREIGDFLIALGDGAAVRVDPDAHVTVILSDGRIAGFHPDSPPAGG